MTSPESATGRETPADPSLEYLLARLHVVERRVRAAVRRRRESDPTPDDHFRGLYITDDGIDALLLDDRPPLWSDAAETARAAVEAEADDWATAGAYLRLRELARSFTLDTLDVEILLIALAPDVDPRFERLYGYLNDDVTRRRASIGLALELCGVSASDSSGRDRFAAPARLVEGGLLTIEDGERPFLTRALRVPDRVTAYLLGSDDPDPAVGAVLDSVVAAPASEAAEPVTRALLAGISPLYLREGGRAAARSVVAACLEGWGGVGVFVDLGRVAAAADPRGAARAAVCEARLRNAVLVAGPVEELVRSAPAVIGELADGRAQVVLTGQRNWVPEWSRAVPLSLEASPSPPAARDAIWRAVLNGHGDGDLAAELLHATAGFRLTPGQITRAARAGVLHATAHARPVEPGDLQAGARAQNGAGLDRLARRIQPGATWSDLVLPADVDVQLRELAARARHRERVYAEWRIGGGTRGNGLTALFAGDSGTGKTLAAEVVAGELGLDLYVIDLSTVIDKYIGETEKNLDRIFAEADHVNGVLLFDEADAIFGKRSEVRDARDRYANVEVAYLLQRMERFDGLAVLTTNLRANLDEAFTRRIDVIVDFPMPETAHRLALWRMHLPPELPRSADLDLQFMAERFRLSGGNIRNVCLTAAFLAADADRPVMMRDLIRGTELEYRKLGRLTVEAEFGPYLDLARGQAAE